MLCVLNSVTELVLSSQLCYHIVGYTLACMCDNDLALAKVISIVGMQSPIANHDGDWGPSFSCSPRGLRLGDGQGKKSLNSVAEWCFQKVIRMDPGTACLKIALF